MSTGYVKPHSGGKVANDRRRNLQYFLTQMTNEDRARKKALEGRKNDVIGPRKQIIAAYEVNFDINDAIAVMNDINNKIGKRAYTEDMIRAWIQEYEDKNKSRDDDDDAR